MNEDEVIAYVRSMQHVVAWRPSAGDGTPEIAWGDTFFYYSPDGRVPGTGQPFATITTKDYPGEPACGLEEPGAFRVNIHAGAHAYARHCGHAPRQAPPATTVDHRRHDTVLPHPAYARLGWVCVTNPAQQSGTVTRELLATAHRLAHERHRRRPQPTGDLPDGDEAAHSDA